MAHKTVYRQAHPHPFSELQRQHEIAELETDLTLYSIEYTGRLLHDNPDRKRIAEVVSLYRAADARFRELLGHSFSAHRRKKVEHHKRK
jgi:hypothetical protein